jgi:hypothetical protein
MIHCANPTGRSTDCRQVRLGPHVLSFSYETLIGYSGPNPQGGRDAYVARNTWGRTTGRHMNELYLRDTHTEVSADEVKAIASRNMMLDREALQDRLVSYVKTVVDDVQQGRVPTETEINAVVDALFTPQTP